MVESVPEPAVWQIPAALLSNNMDKQIIKDSLKIGALIVAILFIFVVGLPFLVSDEFDEILLSILGR